MDKFDDRRSMKSSPRSCFYFSKNKSLGIRCTLDTSFKGDRQRNVRTGGGRGWEWEEREKIQVSRGRLMRY